MSQRCRGGGDRQAVNLGIGGVGLRVGGGGHADVDLGLGFAIMVRRPYRSWSRTKRLVGGQGVEDQRRSRLEEGGRRGGAGAADCGWRWHAVRPMAETGVPMQREKEDGRWRKYLCGA
jgi:hypothetical protein